MILGMLLCVYFSYHLLQGQRSLTGLMITTHKIAQAEILGHQLAQDRVQLEEKVKMMRPGTLDRDLLEERIQDVLGYTQKDDYVISTH